MIMMMVMIFHAGDLNKRVVKRKPAYNDDDDVVIIQIKPNIIKCAM